MYLYPCIINDIQTSMSSEGIFPSYLLKVPHFHLVCSQLITGS